METDRLAGLLDIRIEVIMIKWNGVLPVRRYAIFNDIVRGDYMIVVKDEDIDRAEKWGGFVSWLGGVKPAEKRNLCKCITDSYAAAQQ